MKKILAIGASVLFTLLAGTAAANEEHHPADAKPAVTSMSESAKQSAQPDMQMQQMNQMMKKMQDMHGKMMSAKTTKECQNLMGEHMKMMQDGMSMMQNMGGKGASMKNGNGAAGMPMAQ
ncbi:MAG: hypothetical protein HHJ12_04095 [Glaciimonas sp.]|nr:hypothetical protein [Glaciimonas sp.]